MISSAIEVLMSLTFALIIKFMDNAVYSWTDSFPKSKRKLKNSE